MPLSKKSTYKNLLFLSTALTANLLFPVGVFAQTSPGTDEDGKPPVIKPEPEPICKSGICTIKNEVLVSELSSNNILGEATYNFEPTTINVSNLQQVNTIIGGQTGKITKINSTPIEEYEFNIEGGIYARDNTGLAIQAGNGSFDFSKGGVIWDASAGISDLGDGETVTVYDGGDGYGPLTFKGNGTNNGDFTISSGTFKGAIDIRKGSDINTISFQVEDEETEYKVISSGNLLLAGGTFNFTNTSQILMYESTTGNLQVSSGTWNVDVQNKIYRFDPDTKQDNQLMPEDVKVINNGDGSIIISGGTFNIAKDNMLTLQGGKGTIGTSASGNTLIFTGDGWLNLDFQENVDITSEIVWQTGGIELANGTLRISSNVQLESFHMEKDTASVVINKDAILSTKNFGISGLLSGEGTLNLLEGGSAEFGTLNNFGTIQISSGTVTFKTGEDPDTTTSSLQNLVGSEKSGDASGTNGEFLIGATIGITNVKLNNSRMELSAELRVESIDFGTGTLVFANKDNGLLTLTGNTTIYNTSKIITDSSVDSEATAGRITVKTGKTLTFADAAGTTDPFSSTKLGLNLESNSTINFNGTSVNIDSINALVGTVSVNTGTVSLNTFSLGSENNATLNIANGSILNVNDTLTVNKGGVATITGTLNVKNLTTDGDDTSWGEIKGTGTLEITGNGTFRGKISDLNQMNVVGTSGSLAQITLDRQSDGDDIVRNMKIENGIVNLTKGRLVLDDLQLNNGTINLKNENVILALQKTPPPGDGKNSISGLGTLELLNDAGIEFGGGSAETGGVGYLGGLKINRGTAKITGDTTLGGISFSDDSYNGTLEIADDVTLTLATKADGMGAEGCTKGDNCRITTKVDNYVLGENATLKLYNGNGSEFGGKVVLKNLQFQSGSDVSKGTISFTYSGESTIGNFQVNRSNGANVVVDNGTLSITEFFYGSSKTGVSGSGSFMLNNGGSFTTAGNTLNKLIVGSGTTTIESAGSQTNNKFNEIVFAADVTGTTLKLEDRTEVLKSIVVGQNNEIIKGDGNSSQLILNGATGTFYSTLSNLNEMILKNGAIAYVNANTQVGESGDVTIESNSRIVIGKGYTFKVGKNLGSQDDTTYITGEGTLNFAGNVIVNSILDGLSNIDASSGTSVINNVSNLSGKALVGNEARLTFGGGSIGNGIEIDGSGEFTVNGDTTTPTVTFNGEGGELIINANRVLTVTDNIVVSANNKISSSSSDATRGILFLSGNATGTFSMNDEDKFDGGILIDQGTAYIQTSAAIGSIAFNTTTGGTLDIADGETLNVGTIQTDGQNKISGAGTLNITGQGSSFKAAISDLKTLQISNGSAAFYNDISIGTLAFNGSGEVNLNAGMTMTVNELTQSNLAQGSNLGIIYGDGSFVAGTGTMDFSSGGKSINNITVGSGVLNFISESKVGTLQYSSVEGTVNIEDGVMVSVASGFSGVGNLTGASSSHLYLMGNASATFNKADNYFGQISADSGSLSFMSDMNLSSLVLTDANSTFYRSANITTVRITDGSATFDQTANVKDLDIEGKGSAIFKDTATLDTMTIAAGSVSFAKDATISGKGVNSGDSVSATLGTGGSLDIGVNTLTIESGNFVMDDSSRLALRISREATDSEGNPNFSGYGKIVMKEGTLEIRSDVTLDVTIDYGVKTTETGTILQLVEGNKYGSFNFENNRYTLKEESCASGNGICYRLIQTSTGGNSAQQVGGNANQVNVAQAFLDGELFDYGTQAYSVAEHLDRLSQSKDKSDSYLKALTAVAPDVSGGMTRHPMIVHSKISNTLSSRLNGLSSNMGSSSRTYQSIQRLYGRSGGSPYQSRFMRSQDYYRRAGYYDQDDEPTTKVRPAYQRRLPAKTEQAEAAVDERKQWAQNENSYAQPKQFGFWAETFSNSAEYRSANEPEGFSGDTTGFAFGADVQLLDVFAVGIGYASTSTTLDTLQRSSDMSSSSFFLYGMYKPSDWFVNSVMTLMMNSYDEVKDLSGMTVSDNYDGDAFGMSVMFGKNLKSWTPAVGLRYVSASRDSHKDSVGQDISGISSDVLTLVAEGRMNYDFGKTNNSLWHTELVAGLTYDISSSGEDAMVNLPNGSAYSVVGEELEPLGVELGASIAYMWNDKIDVSAGYNLEWRSDYTAHTLTAAFRYSF